MEETRIVVRCKDQSSGFYRMRTVGAATLTVAAGMFLASCGGGGGETGGGGGGETGSGGGGQTGSGGGATTQAGGGSTMAGGGSTMAGGGSTMAGGGSTMGGTTGGDTMMGGTTGGGTTASGPAITDLQTIIDDPNKQSLAGREVRLSSAPVQDVVGDVTFLIGPGADQTVFAVLGDELSGDQADAAVNIDPGETLSLVGTLRQVPSAQEAQQTLGLTQAEAGELRGEDVYLLVEEAEAAQ